MKTDSLGDRMKIYENIEAGRILMPGLPIIARIDGRAFHSFTRGMPRPFCGSLALAMIETTVELVKHTGARIGYTQSDEISLAWYAERDSQTWFNGRVCKMTSQLAAQATLTFYLKVLEYLPAYAGRLPTFDARVWNVPSKTEAANAFLWREKDATKNSISMAAQAYYSHKELLGKSGSEKQEMLWRQGINWNNFPDYFKRGTFVQTRKERVPFSSEEISNLPEKHEARKNPGLLVERSVVKAVQVPPFGNVLNREGFIFDGEEPRTSSGEEG